MNNYPSGTAVTVDIPFLDLNGAAVVPTALSYQVLDELENVVQLPQSLPLIDGATTVSVSVPALANTLAAPYQSQSDGNPLGQPIVTTTGLREVQLSMTCDAGVVVTKIQYLLRATDAQLILMQNSFQTYNLSLIVADGQTNLMAWSLATEQVRINAMIQAYRALTNIGYFVRWPRDPDAQNIINWFDSRNERIAPRLWAVMSTDRWYSYYPETFRVAMRTAQIVEADQILYNDPILSKRLSGVFSEKVGESSTMLRSQNALNLGISRQALACVQGFVDLKMQFSRT